MARIRPPYDLLIVTTDSVIAGTERMILSYLEGHNRLRYRPHLVTLVGPGDLAVAARNMGVPAEHLNVRSAFQAAMKLYAAIRRIRPAIIHSYLFHTNILARLLRLAAPVPVLVCGMRTVYLPGAYPRWYHRLDGLTHTLCDRFIANSNAGRDSLVHMAGIPPDKIEVIPNGIDTRRFQKDSLSARSQLEAGFFVPKDACLFGIVAQLRAPKGHDILFRATHAVIRHRPNVHLMVIGDGPERGHLEHLRNRLRLDASITLAGYVQDIPTVLAGLDAFVLPSTLEGSPVSVMEAMAAGLPVIAADCGGIHEIVNESCGMLVTPRDEQSLADAMKALADDGELRRRLGDAARERIRSLFSLEVMCKRIEEVYDRLLEDLIQTG